MAYFIGKVQSTTLIVDALYLEFFFVMETVANPYSALPCSDRKR